MALTFGWTIIRPTEGPPILSLPLRGAMHIYEKCLNKTAKSGAALIQDFHVMVKCRPPTPPLLLSASLFPVIAPSLSPGSLL